VAKFTTNSGTAFTKAPRERGGAPSSLKIQKAMRAAFVSRKKESTPAMIRSPASTARTGAKVLSSTWPSTMGPWKRAKRPITKRATTRTAATSHALER
jgi:hypothetical protein